MSKFDGMSLVQEFIKLMIKIRKENKVNLEQLADLAGLHRTTIGLLERGERTPSLQVAAQIADALGYQLSDMIKDAELIITGTVPEEEIGKKIERRKVEPSHLRNGKILTELTGLPSTTIQRAIEYCYHTLDIIDEQLVTAESQPIGELVELANLSSMIGNLLGSGVSLASEGLYKRNRPHAYPDLVPQRKPAVDLEIKIALETNSPKSHLPKAGNYLTFRYVLCDKEGDYSKGKDSRGNTAWIWEVRVGALKEEDFSISNTAGDSGKTAVIKSASFQNMTLIYYVPALLPYSVKKDGSYPGFN
jgi:transcriptional regulator with XRE-family HTH domain